MTRLAPRLVAPHLTGDDLTAFADIPATAHVKAFLPPAGHETSVLPDFGPNGPMWSDGPRPSVRTYTPRRFTNGLLEIQFLLHGAGPAATWQLPPNPVTTSP